MIKIGAGGKDFVAADQLLAMELAGNQSGQINKAAVFGGCLAQVQT